MLRLRKTVTIAAVSLAAACAFLVSEAQEKPPETPALPAGVKAGAKPGEFVCEKDGAPMVLVPAGPFAMGCTKALSAIEGMEAVPDHVAKTGAYYIDVYEVTNARYARFLQAIATDGHKTCPRDEPKDKDHKPADWKTDVYALRSPGDDYPVCGIDWHDARAYCAWAGKRLPTETEWEKASRGTDARRYPWGDESPRSDGAIGLASKLKDGTFPANWNGNADGYDTCSPVGKFPRGASPYGCQDIAGNVWEWTESSFTLYPGCYDNLKELYPESTWGETRIYRGGSWSKSTQDLQCTHRHWMEPTKRVSKDSPIPDMGARGVITATSP
jgi:formylglycine-generating enzyme required for sulfatase activity